MGEAQRWILDRADEVQVVSPPELRERVKVAAKAAGWLDGTKRL